MNLTPNWAEYLTKAEFQAVHWSSLGLSTAPDSEIMAFAQVGGYVVFTRDLDFSAILACTHGNKPSVVQLRLMEVLPENIGGTVVQALRQVETELEAGAVLTVDSPKRIRLALLPFVLPQ
jgi:predicted nuclease of predicted toxin-antitoxin system